MMKREMFRSQRRFEFIWDDGCYKHLAPPERNQAKSFRASSGRALITFKSLWLCGKPTT